jgi:hypothetical protein
MMSITKFIFNFMTVERIGRFVAVCIGSFVSPTWLLIQETLKPYIHLASLSRVGALQSEMTSMMIRFHQHPDHVATVLIPSLLGCLVFSFAYLYICGKLGEYGARYLLKTDKGMPSVS